MRKSSELSEMGTVNVQTKFYLKKRQWDKTNFLYFLGFYGSIAATKILECFYTSRYRNPQSIFFEIWHASVSFTFFYYQNSIYNEVIKITKHCARLNIIH